MSQLPVGSIAPDFELTDTDGRLYRLSDALAHGRVALVFYKSSCPTCQFTFPYIQKIFEKANNDAGWTLWAISEEEQYGLAFEVLIDEHPYDVSAAYGLKFVPAIFLIEPNGKISVSEYGFSKAGLNGIAGFEYFTPNDGLPASRPG
jgi:peroxiredoxin